MIIWGSRGITRVRETGDFHCPACAKRSPYERKQVRRFFTLYFIPLFPTADLGEYVECVVCRKSYKPEVLQIKPPPSHDELLALYSQHLTRLLAGCAALDGEPVGRAEQIRAEVISATGREPQSQWLLPADEERAPAPVALKIIAAELAPILTDSAKEQVFGAAFRILGESTHKASSALSEIGTGFGLSPAHITGLLATLRQPNTQ